MILPLMDGFDKQVCSSCGWTRGCGTAYERRILSLPFNITVYSTTRYGAVCHAIQQSFFVRKTYPWHTFHDYQNPPPAHCNTEGMKLPAHWLVRSWLILATCSLYQGEVGTNVRIPTVKCRWPFLGVCNGLKLEIMRSMVEFVFSRHNDSWSLMKL